MWKQDPQLNDQSSETYDLMIEGWQYHLMIEGQWYHLMIEGQWYYLMLEGWQYHMMLEGCRYHLMDQTSPFSSNLQTEPICWEQTSKSVVSTRSHFIWKLHLQQRVDASVAKSKFSTLGGCEWRDYHHICSSGSHHSSVLHFSAVKKQQHSL